MKKLSNKEFADDIKTYLVSSHDFYRNKVPEMRVLAKRLHEEYSLKEFYKVFNKMWNSKYHGETSLAIYTLRLYSDEFNLATWRFLKSKLMSIKSFDQADSIGKIIGEILIKHPASMKREVIKLSKSKNLWLVRLALASSIPLIRKGDFKLGMKFVEDFIDVKEKYIQECVGIILREIGNKKPEVAKRFILKHIHMNHIVFKEATATTKLKELRKLRKIKKLGKGKRGFFSWRR